MTKTSDSKSSRRDFLKLTAATAAFGPFFLFPDRAAASQKTLKIAKWAHFLPEFDQWFVNVLAREWGQKKDIKITVDLIPVEEVYARAKAEIKAGKGHDVFMFPWPSAEFFQYVIDHAEIYQTVAQKYGQIDHLAYRSTFHPTMKKYFGFADSWIPTPFLYFEDYWTEIGAPFGPVHWDGLRSGSRDLHEKLGIPCGLALAPSLESNITLHTMLYAFTSFLLYAGKAVINNARTFTALQYVKYLYQWAGTPEQLTWGPGGNVKAMLARKTSCTINSISLLRQAEKQDPELSKKIMLAPPLKGSNGVAAMPNVTNCSVVWSFAKNQEEGKQFLADLIDNSTNIYEQSRGCNFPFYQKTVPDLIVRLAKDPKANPAWKYTALKDALHWTHNLGAGGFATPVFMEIFNTFVVPRMFLSVVKGERTPGDAMDLAAAEVQRISDKWRQIGS